MTTKDDIPSDELRSLIKNMPAYWEVSCNHCWFSEPCLSEDEAMMRGEMHEECHEDDDIGHKCMLLQMRFGSEPPEELGFGDGGFEDHE